MRKALAPAETRLRPTELSAGPVASTITVESDAYGGVDYRCVSNIARAQQGHAPEAEDVKPSANGVTRSALLDTSADLERRGACAARRALSWRLLTG